MSMEFLGSTAFGDIQGQRGVDWEEAQVGDIAADTAGEVVKKLIGVDVAADEIRAAVQPPAGE